MREEDIWVFYTYVDKVISNLAEIPLSVFDLCRIEKMRRKEDRERSLAGRLLLQHAIMNLNISKDAICTIEWDKFKKPFIKSMYPFQFNISHSGQCVVCALTSGRVGVDIEKMDYRIDINDFANNWYINVGNSKCQYVIELGRRPIEFTDKIKTDFLSISSSNVIESPNDHVLFFKDTNKVLYRNINTNKYTELILKPFLKNISSIYKDMHLADNENINESMFDFNNPSSQNPTSNVL